MDSLSPDQKAELVLDPSSGALENVTVLTEVFGSIVGSPDDGELDRFWEACAAVTAQVSGSHGRSNFITCQIPSGTTVVSSVGLCLASSLTDLPLLFLAKHHLHYQRSCERRHAQPDTDGPGSQIPHLPNERLYPVVPGQSGCSASQRPSCESERHPPEHQL